MQGDDDGWAKMGKGYLTVSVLTTSGIYCSEFNTLPDNGFPTSICPYNMTVHLSTNTVRRRRVRQMCGNVLSFALTLYCALI